MSKTHIRKPLQSFCLLFRTKYIKRAVCVSLLGDIHFQKINKINKNEINKLQADKIIITINTIKLFLITIF